MGNLNSIFHNSLGLLDDIIAKEFQKESPYLSLLEQKVYHALHKEYRPPANIAESAIKPIQRIDSKIQKQMNEKFIKTLNSIRGRIKDKRIPKK